MTTENKQPPKGEQPPKTPLDIITEAFAVALSQTKSDTAEVMTDKDRDEILAFLGGAAHENYNVKKIVIFLAIVNVSAIVFQILIQLWRL